MKILFAGKTNIWIFATAFLTALCGNSLHAQKSAAVEINVGRAFNGSGDMHGLIIGTRLIKEGSQRFGWDVLLATTVHDGYDLIEYSENGNFYSQKFKYGATGVQLGGHLWYDLVKKTSHKFGIGLGPVVRYQTSSDGGYEVLYPLITNLPVPVIILDSDLPQRTVSVGASGELNYRYLFSNKLALGVHFGLQTDTQGDLIRYSCISFGRHF